MQISRLFEIVYILLNERTVTARKLAERFEVSTRTIYRDVDALAAAGIPVYTHKGKGGGISLTDNFVLGRSMLSEDEQDSILNALQGLDLRGMQHAAGTDALLSKLSGVFRKSVNHWIQVDFSDWGPGGGDVFYALQAAILDKKEVTFTYYNSMGECSRRTAQPLQLWLKHRVWYLRAHCLAKDAERLFRLSRIQELSVSDRSFERTLGEHDDPPQPTVDMSVAVSLRIHPSMAWRVYDEFHPEQITRDKEEHYLVDTMVVEDEWTYGMLLSYGENAELLAPARMRRELAARIDRMKALYADSGA